MSIATTNNTRAKRITKAQVVARWHQLNPGKTRAQSTLDSVATAWWSIRDEDPTPSKMVSYQNYWQPSEAWMQSVEDML